MPLSTFNGAACWLVMAGASPLIVTLHLDDASLHFFQTQRRRYFPPERNFLKAHLTLFHNLPSPEEKITRDLQRWATQTTAFTLDVSAVVGIGKGVAYKIESPELMKLHKTMQEEWRQWLVPQDKQKLWPHVTVQNKVSPTIAKETVHELQKDFQPFTAQALGFSLWHYEGGPWRFEADYKFA